DPSVPDDGAGPGAEHGPAPPTRPAQLQGRGKRLPAVHEEEGIAGTAGPPGGVAREALPLADDQALDQPRPCRWPASTSSTPFTLPAPSVITTSPPRTFASSQRAAPSRSSQVWVWRTP